ncbi:PKD domain-containing protein [Paenibacillus filicis]|uniref:PKD domain-containing protein n=1 Tax=Paenibacillus gyeongsangnamensis TaxID=3388067 RepID=A0ABT4QE43_9BACL|nr:CARDB domain-containing protein [Paenibacillus filicis]MCZ8515156.1 PKD domain-containing protein [Paenibacillus filicis]
MRKISFLMLFVILYSILSPFIELLPARAARSTSGPIDVYIAYDSTFKDLENGRSASSVSSVDPNRIYANGSYYDLSGTTMNLSDLGIDTSQLESANLKSFDGQQLGNCTPSSCVFGTLNGKPVNVQTDENNDSGYFDWWRNFAGGPHSYWWSYDHRNGETYYFGEDENHNRVYSNPWGDCGPAPCDYPGDFSSILPWDMDMSAYPFHGLDANGVSIQVSSESVASKAATVEATGNQIGPAQNIAMNGNTVTWKQYIGPFKAGGTLLPGGQPGTKGISWAYTNSVQMSGVTYLYPKKWTLTLNYKPSGKPDLVPSSLTASSSCIAAGVPTTFTLKYKNIGVSTPDTFYIDISIDGSSVKTITVNGLSAGAESSSTFEYTFPTSGSKTFLVKMDSTDVIDEGMNKGNNTLSQPVTVQASCGEGGGTVDPPPEGSVNIDADFKIMKDIVEWKENNLFTPTKIEVTGSCSYKEHYFSTYQRSGQPDEAYYQYAPHTNKTGATGMGWPYQSKTSPVTPGRVDVIMVVKTDCDEIKAVTHSFTIKAPPVLPPTLEIAWVDPSVPNTPIYTSIVGLKASLKVMKAEDPNGDPVTKFDWDFPGSNSTWVQNLPGKYGWSRPYSQKQYDNITLETAGAHKVCATATSASGGVSAPACAMITVKGPNPTPIITGGTSVKVYRTLNPPLSSDQSFTDYPGRSIDHSRDEWTNKAGSYSTPGTVTVTLDVLDNTGLKSLAPATHNITVLPDIPPVPDLAYSSTMVRGNPRSFRNTSYSPDGDTIVQYQVTHGYVSQNNGSCSPYEVLDSNDNNDFTFNPTLVGKYCFNVFAKEDYGLTANKVFMVDVVNNAPEATFTVSGDASEPDPPDLVSIPPSQFVGGSWTNTNLDGKRLPSMWRATANGTLSTIPRNPDVINEFYDFAPSMLKNYSTPGYTQPVTATSGQRIVFSPNLHDPRATYTQVRTYLGNGAFIGTQDGCAPFDSSCGSGNGSLLVVNPYFPSVELAFGKTRDLGHTYNELLGEVIVTQSLGTTSHGSHWYNKSSWKRYKASNLQSGNAYVEASGTVELPQTNGDPIYGTPATYSDGSTNAYSSNSGYNGTLGDGGAGIKFLYDWKAVDIKNAKMMHYRTPNNSSLYKTDDLSGIWGPSQWNLGECAKEDFQGNIWCAFNNFVMKLDAETGAPTVVASGFPQIDLMAYYTTYWQPNVTLSMNADKTLAMFNAYYTRNGVVDPFYKKYIDTRTNQQFDAIPPGYNTDFSSTKDDYFRRPTNGFGLFTTTVSCTKYDPDMGYYQSTCDVKVPGDVGAKSQLGGDVCYVVGDDGILCGGLLKSDGTVDPPYFIRYTPDGTQTPTTNEYFTFGQLINYGMTPMQDGEINYSLKFNVLKNDEIPAGMGFRIQDSKNMYRIEAAKNKVRLIKIVNGRKTTLGQSTRPLTEGAWNSYRIKLSGTQIRVYENGTKLFDLNDGTYAQGTFGPFSLAERAEFKGIYTIDYPPSSMYRVNGVAIVDTAVHYETTYYDQENDPAYAPGTQWHYDHTDPWRFLDAGDGKIGVSAVNGHTVSGPVLSFDKVGLYTIKYRLPDDPNPDHRLAYGDTSFQSYSQYSDWYSRNLIVHRRPIVQFTVSQASANSLVTWSNSSYDPDHCDSGLNCQNGYQTNHGIYYEKYYYITPSGNRIIGKLVHPTESGTYTVGKAVGDEYRAWSDFMEQTLNVDCSVCAPNNPPTAVLTFPNGGISNPSPVTLQPTITWNQGDPDPGTVFTVFDLEIRDVNGNCYECVYNRSMNTLNTSWAWSMDMPLQMGGQYQVRVRVSDGEMFSAWSNIGWMITNRPPVAYMSFPYGTQASPTMVSTVRPQFIWSQTDPDPGTTFTYFQLQVANAANAVAMDTGNVWEGTTSTTGYFTPGMDMPTNEPMRVRVQVMDGYAWSGFSPDAWMIINRPPTVALTFPTGTYAAPNVIGTGTPTISWIQGDPDPQVIFTAYQVQVLSEGGAVLADSGKQPQNTTATTGSWIVNTPLPQGRKLQVRAAVWDQYDASSGWSAAGWMYINRPPVAEFDWTPQPAYEGDTITLVNQSSDPDGDPLTYLWQMTGPDGYSRSHTSMNASIEAADTDYHPGNYVVTLTVCDPFGACDTLTKTVPVGDLTVKGFVNHFDDWNKKRRSFNTSMTGDPEAPRPYEMFWAGEGFKLEAQTPIAAEWVQVQMEYTELEAFLGSIDAIVWSGQFVNDKLGTLPDRRYRFTFTAKWPNGHIEKDVVTILVKDAWIDFSNTVRKL